MYRGNVWGRDNESQLYVNFNLDYTEYAVLSRFILGGNHDK